MAKYKVFVADTLWPDLIIERDVLEKIGAEVVLSKGGNAAEICKEGKDCDAILVNKTQMSRENQSFLKNCKIIVRFGIGFNEVDIDAATDNGIIVCNVPDYCQAEVADHTIAMLLNVSRKIDVLSKQTKLGKWDASVATGVPRYEGKLLALLGCGGIGRMVAKRAQSFGIQVAGYDPYLPKPVFEKCGITPYDEIDKLLADADFITIHMPLTEESKRIINDRTLSLVKPSAYLVNTSRGGLIDEDALFRAINEGRLAGAGLDVLCQEPPVGINKLAALPNVIVTPHVAWNSEEALPELRSKAAQEIACALTGKTPAHVLNKCVFSKQVFTH